jgi:NhaA family Na+:H+ antiporter
MLHKLEHALAPWSAYLIMPVFALANSGVAFDLNDFPSVITSPVSLGIIFGLFIGKQAGIFGASYLLVKLKVATLPSMVTTKHLYAASILGGIGFTMSLFVSSLSFTDNEQLSIAKISIMTASVLAAVVGLLVFKTIKSQDVTEGSTENLP